MLLLSFSAHAITSPQVRCVLVLSNGNATVTWAIPSDPLNEFKSYEVFYSNTQAGPYTNMASISSYNTNSATCFTCNANVSAYYFYVQVKTLSNATMPALDTVKSMLLTLNSAPLSSLVNFQWNDFKFPLPSGLASSYKVFREYPLGNWTQIGTVPTNTTSVFAYNYFTDTMSVCLDTINYRVELSDPVTGCTSVSSVKGSWFMDKNQPVPAYLDSVSVNSSGQAIIGIHSSFSPDTKCFVVYQYIGTHPNGTYLALDTLCTNNNSIVYTYTASSAGSASEDFSVAAIDSCGNISQIDLGDQSTIHLIVTYDICSKTAQLQWNQYVNMRGGVAKYEILCSVNGGNFISLGDTIAMTYKHKGLVNGNTYCYIVRAHNPTNTISSTSNKFCIIPAPSVLPAYVYLDKVSVINPPEKVDVEWYIDNSVRIGGFEVFHAPALAGPYSSVGVVPSTGASNYAFTDTYVDASLQSYYYRVEVLDTCMNPVMHTDTSNTIHLTAVASGNLSATLTWNAYGRWLGNVSGYNIYRSLDGSFPATPAATVGPGTTTYVDDVSSFTAYSGKFTYYVEAFEGPGNPYGFTATSESNYADVYIDANLFVPNAFIPKGYNKIFLPVADYIEKTDYKLSIFDRWGTTVFETQDQTQGWDGGKYEEGVYAYLIQYKTSIGEYREQRGVVNLIR